MALISFPRVFGSLTTSQMSYLDDNFNMINTVFGVATGANQSPVANNIPIADSLALLRQWMGIAQQSQTGNITLGAANYCSVTELNSASAFNVTLPAASASTSKWFWLKNINTGIVTIVGTVDGIVNPTLSQYDQIFLWSDGTNWFGYVMASKAMISHGMKVFASSGTFTAPVTGSFMVMLMAGGGGGGAGGGGAGIASGGGGGGGAAGEIRFIKVAQTVNDAVTVTINSGGIGGSGVSGGTGGNGTAGGSVVYGAFTANGGNFGAGSANGAGNFGAGGAQAVIAGGSGVGTGGAGASTLLESAVGGGNGAAGTGSNSSAGGGGAGGSSSFARGGIGGNAVAGGAGGAGSSAPDWGAGGGGGGGSATLGGGPFAGGNGGNGGQGLVIIWW